MAPCRHPRSHRRAAASRCAVAALFAFVAASGCAPTEIIDHGVAPCGPLTCRGCCTTDGRCVAGDAFFACGQDGVRCDACAPEQPCTAGRCQAESPIDAGAPVDAGTACDASTCAGCCLDDATCVPYAEQDAARCGASATRCRSCDVGTTCEAGACEATTRCELSVEPTHVGTHGILDFEAWPVGGTLRRDLGMVNTGTRACEVSAPTWTADTDRNAFAFGGQTIYPSTLPPGGRASFPVTFTPYAARNWFEDAHAFTFVVNDGRPSDCAAPTPGCRRIRVRGVGITSALGPTAPLIPQSLRFAPVTVGCRSIWREVLLINASGQPLTLQHAAVTGAGFELQSLTLPSTVAPWSSATLRVRFTATTPGNSSGTLQITDGLEGVRELLLEAEATNLTNRTQSFVQAEAGRADVLFVVHNGSGMMAWQEALGNAASAFIQAATAAGGAWQLGVLTSDVTQANAGLLQGSPKFVTAMTPDAAAAFAQNVRVGAAGAIDQSLEAVRLAQVAPRSDDPLRNGGFFRDDARLGIVLLSDDSAKSPATLDEYVRALNLVNAYRGGPERVRLYPIVPTVECQSGSTHGEAVSLVGGACHPLSAAALPDALKKIANDLFVLRSAFRLDAPVASGSAVSVSVDGTTLVDGTHFTFDAVHNVVRLASPWIPQPGQQVVVSWTPSCHL